MQHSPITTDFDQMSVFSTQFAEGGIATRPTAGIFGEAGAEALIPLDRMSQVMGSMGGGGSNVEINIIGAPEGTRVEESESEQGGRSIDVILDEKMSQQVKPGSKFNNQMLSQFRDMQQSTIRR
jgi:phage-related minor tail protein